MLLKFYTLASSSWLFLLIAMLASAQSPSPRGPKPGYIRLWDMLPPANGSFVVKKAGAPSSEAPLLSATSYEYSSYSEIPVGKYKLAVSKKGEAKPLKTLDVEVKPETFFTILVTPENSSGSIELVDDTINPKVTSGTLVIRNCFAGVTVSVATDTQKLADSLLYGHSLVATDLPATRLPLIIRTKLPNGTPSESTAEVDFKASLRGTLLVIPDSYGRFRPRVTIDGSNR